MLLHSQITTVYLNRRHRLFLFYSQLQPTSTPSQHNYQPQTIENIKFWLNRLGELLLAQKLQIREIKKLVQATHHSCIELTTQQIISMIKLAMNYLAVSKISNVLYYLCRRSLGFRRYLCYLLQTPYFRLSSTWNKSTQKLAILLTDIFLFGVYYTQQQFINDIFLPVLRTEQNFLACTTQTNQQKYSRIIFQLNYLQHYLQILSLPEILSQKYRTRLLQKTHEYLSHLLNTILSQYHQQMTNSLTKLQQIYTKPNESQNYKEYEQIYMKNVHLYENIRMRIIGVIQVFVNGSGYKNNVEICGQWSFQGLLEKVGVQYQSVLYVDGYGQNQQKQDRQSTANEDGEGSSSRSDSYNQTSQQQPSKTQQKKHLLKIYNTCKHFHNSTIYHPDNLYTLPPITTLPSPTLTTTTSTQGYTFLQQIPQSYLESLNNCTDISTSDTLAFIFLKQYNKYCNRVKLVQVVMRDLCERINVGYIVRVLAIVRLVQKDQIDQLVQEEIRAIVERSFGRLNKGLYGRYAQLIIQLIKFNITPAQPYLKNLLSLLQQSNSPSHPQPQSQPTSPSIPQTPKPHTLQPTTFLQTTITLLQKLGRQLYYHSLPAHIIFNEIIGYIYHHIRTKTVCYDMDTVNRFNCLVMYLQCVKKKDEEEQRKMEILLVSYLKNQRNFKNQVKNIQRNIKKDYNGKDSISRITDIFEYSIEKQNYMDLYLYADLVYQVGSKKLDDAIKKLAMKCIKKQLDQGNYQGATNWSRFYGELHRYGICSQKQLIGFLNNTILNDYFNKYPAASIKVISTTIQACQDYMKNTTKISQISQTLTFLLITKKQLLKIKGLKNSILEQQIQDILQYFHIGFKYVRSVDDCTKIQKKINGKNCDVQKLMNQYQDQSKVNDERLERMRQKQRIQEENNEKYLGIVDEETAKYVQKQQRSQYRQKNKSTEKIDELELSQLETNASNKPKPTQPKQTLPEQQKSKKIKIISRSKTDNKKIQKKQIVI